MLLLLEEVSRDRSQPSSAATGSQVGPIAPVMRVGGLAGE